MGKHTLVSKWIKTMTLMRSKTLSGYVPETRRLTPESLKAMLQKHRMVYLKPVKGSQGKGVIRAEMATKPGVPRFQYQIGTKKRTFDDFHPFLRSVERARYRKPYLVQQGIPLLTYDGRRFDVRIMVQRTASRPWQATGYIGRLAHPKRIVTNYHSQGTAMPLERLLAPHLSGAAKRRFRRDLLHLGVRIARHLNRRHPHLRELGIDFGIDKQLKPWVLEVNTGPDVHIFKELKDKKIFNRVLRLSKENGRYRKVKFR
jgi:hypothetical protein